ncbi:MAG: hypothetical protein WBB98_04640 [Xanthobacteraceae bacterium]
MENNKAAAAHNPASKSIIVSDNLLRVIAVNKHHVAVWEVGNRQIERAALTQLHLEPTIVQRQFSSHPRRLTRLYLAGEVVSAGDVYADVSLNGWHIPQNSRCGTTVVASKLNNGARIHRSH